MGVVYVLIGIGLGFAWRKLHFIWKTKDEAKTAALLKAIETIVAQQLDDTRQNIAIFLDQKFSEVRGELKVPPR